MGIAGVVRDKDTELGIADAVISVDGINHDVTTGGCVGEGLGQCRGGLNKVRSLRPLDADLALHFSAWGGGLLAPADPRGLHGDCQRRGATPHSDTELPGHL